MSADVTACAGRTPGARVLLDALEPRRLLSGVAPEPTGLPGVYHTTALLSEAREGATVAQVGDDVIFAGGDVTNVRTGVAVMSSAVDVYDARTGQWSAYRLSEPREYMRVITVGSTVLFVGGATQHWSSTPSRAVDAFNTATGTWSHTTLSRYADYMTIETVGSKVVFAGGFDQEVSGNQNPQARPSAAVDVYDADTGQWSHATLSVAREGIEAAVVGDRLILAGGWARSNDNARVASAAVDVYDAASGTWSTAVLSQARGYMVGVVVGTRAIFTGGSIPKPDGTEAGSNAADVYDAATGQWSATTSDDPLVKDAVSGSNGRTAYVDSERKLELKDAQTGQWSALAIPDDWGHGIYQRGPGVFAVLGDKVIVGTGNTYDNSRQVDVYDVTTGQWSQHRLENDHYSGEVIAGKFVFSGGSAYDAGYAESNLIEVYDPASDTWSMTTLDGTVEPVETIGDRLFLDEGAGLTVFDAATGAVASLPVSLGREGATFGQVSGEFLEAGGSYYSRKARKTYWSTAVDLFGPSAIGQPGDPSVPAGAALAAAPTELTWSAADGADAYDVYLDDQLVATVTEPRWTIDRPLAAGRHAWQVVARNGTDVTGSPRWAFTLGAADAASAPGIRDGRRLRETVTALSWTPSAGATSEDLYLDGRKVGTTSSGALPLPEPVAGGAHAWQVVSHNALGTTAGPVWHFTTPASGLRHDVSGVSPTPETFDTALTVGDAAVFVDIYGGVAVYDPATGTLSRSSLALPSGYGRTVVGTTVMFAGGDVGRITFQATDKVTSFDVLTGRVRAATLSQAREGIAATTVGQTALFAGGSYFAGNWNDSDVVDLFDAASGSWTTARLSQARTVGAAVSVGGKAIFAGGGVTLAPNAQPVPSDVVDVYDASSGSWTTATLSHAAQTMATAVVGTRAYFAGDGWLDVYDARTGAWATVAGPPGVSGAPADAVAVGRSIYFVNGQSSYQGGLVAIFDTRTGRWTTAALSTPRQWVRVAVVGRRVIFAGGSEGSDLVDVLDTDSGQWSVEKLGVETYSTTAATVGNTVVIATNAYDASGSEVDRFTDSTVPAAPSLSGSVRGAPAAAAATPGSSHRIGVTVQNAAGAAAVAGPFVVDVYLSKDGTVGSPAATLVGRAVVSRPLAGGAATRVTLSVRVPKGLADGTYRLITAVRGLAGDVTVLNDRAIEIRQQRGATYA